MKIVSLAPSNTEILFALGLGDSICGVTVYCDYPKEAKNKPIVGSWINPNIAEIKTIKPDLVLTSTIVQEKVATALAEASLPVLHVNPKTLEGIYQSIVAIGRATNKDRSAQKLVQEMQRKAQKHRVVAKGKRPKVYIEEWHRPPYASGNWVPELVNAAGGRYDLVKPGQLSREVTTDEILTYNPDIIILSICGFGDILGPDLVKKRQDWTPINAIKNQTVFTIDDTILNRPGPRIVNAIPYLRTLFYR